MFLWKIDLWQNCPTCCGIEGTCFCVASGAPMFTLWACSRKTWRNNKNPYIKDTFHELILKRDLIFVYVNLDMGGACGSLVVKALGYKPEGRGFETRWDEILSLPNPSARSGPGVHSACNRNEYRKHYKEITFLWSKVRQVRGADNLTAIYEPIV
jgi:hypothetical protein